jgi:hypothetical protein
VAATPASPSSPTSTAAVDARAAAPRRHRSIAGRALIARRSYAEGGGGD